MKIIITEAQYEELTEEALRQFLFSFWNNQKKRGEVPFLDDIIYQVTGINKDSRDDYEVIRPIWFEYQGGYKHLLQQIKDEIELHLKIFHKQGITVQQVKNEENYFGTSHQKSNIKDSNAQKYIKFAR
jgi:hypothetical protein